MYLSHIFIKISFNAFFQLMDSMIMKISFSMSSFKNALYIKWLSPSF
mgnify:CR=1 FL=1